MPSQANLSGFTLCHSCSDNFEYIDLIFQNNSMKSYDFYMGLPLMPVPGVQGHLSRDLRPNLQSKGERMSECSTWTIQWPCKPELVGYEGQLVTVYL